MSRKAVEMLLLLILLILLSSGAAWTGGFHQKPATQSADMMDTAADAANLGNDDHDFAAFDDFDEIAASGEMCTSSPFLPTVCTYLKDQLVKALTA